MGTKDAKGITLVALVVTIIVLLILAGVVLNLTIGQNGIIQRSTNAMFTHKQAVANEETGINNVIDKLDSIAEESKKEPSYIPDGFTHKEGTIDTGYVIQDASQNELVWIPVDGVNLELKRIDYANGNEYKNGYEAEDQLEPFKESVKNYKGFYLARYEAGIPENMTESISDINARDVEGTPVSKKDAIPWNNISQLKSKINATHFSSNSIYPSILINSYIWDTTLQWIINSKNDVSLEQVRDDSRSWGNYSNSQPNEITKYSTDNGATWITTTRMDKPDNTQWLLSTGNTIYTMRNNIYDLAGNLCEWTTETDGSIYRGASYASGSVYFTAGNRFYDIPYDHFYNVGFRFAVYKA